jgi:hypothetical protein
LDGVDRNMKDTAGEEHIASVREQDDRMDREGSIQRSETITEGEEGSFHTARETQATRATIAKGARAISEAPSVANSFKPSGQRAGDQGQRGRATVGVRRLIMGDQATAEGTSSDTAIRRQNTGGSRARRNEATSMVNNEGSGITQADSAALTASGSEGTRMSTRGRKKARRTQTRMGYKQQVKPIFEILLGQLELALLAGMEDTASIRSETKWTTVECPAIVRLFVNKQREFARFLMDAGSYDEAVGSLINLQGAWDMRKTKKDTEERSLQEAGQAVFATIQKALSDKMEGEGWKTASK